MPALRAGKGIFGAVRTGGPAPEPPAQGAPARDGYWSLDDLRGKTSLPDTPAPGFSAPLPQEPSGLNIMHTTPLFQPDEMPLPVPPVQDQPHCPSCGAQLRKQQPFCPFCGARTDEPAPPAPAPVQEQPPRCPSCGAQLRKRQPFCPFCGVRIDEAVPPAPVQAQQPEPEPMSAPEQPFIPIPKPAPEPEQPSVPVPEPEPEQPVSEPGPAPGAEQPPVPASGPETDSPGLSGNAPPLRSLSRSGTLCPSRSRICSAAKTGTIPPTSELTAESTIPLDKVADRNTEICHSAEENNRHNYNTENLWFGFLLSTYWFRNQVFFFSFSIAISWSVKIFSQISRRFNIHIAF